MTACLLLALAAVPLLVWAGWHADRLAGRRGDRDRAEAYRRQRLIDALTDPPPGRWN